MSKIPFLWQKHLGNRRGLGHLLSYSNIGKNRQNTFICFEDAGRNALTHGQIRPKDRGKLIVFQNVWFSGPELSLVMASFASSFFCSMWLQLLYLQFSNIWLRFWDMEAKFILQPVHQVRPGCGLKYIQLGWGWWWRQPGAPWRYKRVRASLVNDKVRDMISGRE